MTSPLPHFRDAWVMTLISILTWIGSAATLSIPSLNPLMEVGLWALSGLGFLTATFFALASGFAWRAAWKRLKGGE